MNTKLQTGIVEIDDQHQVLFDTLTDIENAIAGAGKWSVVHFALIKLDGYVRTHFVVEEALLRLHAYPLIEAHIQEHRWFESKLHTLMEQSLQTNVGDELVSVLRDWLILHIGKTDSQYVPHLLSSRVATPPAIA